MARLPLLAHPLQEGSVRLRDAAERDIPEVLIAYEDDPEMHLRLGQDRPPSGAELGRVAESEHADRAAGSRATLTIVSGESDVCVGQVSVHDVDWDHERAEISIWVAPECRGRGLGAAALRLVSGWLLGDCAMARVQLVAEPGNAALARAAARAGFSHEGVLHGYLRVRSRRVDASVLGRLSTEPAP